MFKVPKGFWVEPDQLIEADALQEFHPRFGCSLTSGIPARIEFTAEHPIALVAGVAGSGVSACLDTILYNTLSEYTPSTLSVFYVDCAGVSDGTWTSLKFPHMMNSWCNAKDVGAQKSALREMEKTINCRQDKHTFLVIHNCNKLSTEGLAYIKRMLPVIREHKCSVSVLFVAQTASEVETEILDAADIRICLRGTRTLSESVLGTPFAAYITDKYGMCVSTPDISKASDNMHIYHVPFVPNWRITQSNCERAGKTDTKPLELLIKEKQHWEHLNALAGMGGK